MRATEHNSLVPDGCLQVSSISAAGFPTEVIQGFAFALKILIGVLFQKERQLCAIKKGR